MIRRPFIVLTASVAGAVLSGCYGAKLVKGPVNSDHSARVADTLRADQRRIIDRLDRLERQIARSNEERTSFQAQASVTLSELEEAVRVLVSRIEDTEQLMINRGGRDRSIGSRPVPAEPADSAEEIYRNAYMDVTRGSYELAAQGFQDYLAKFPDGPRAAEAHYYLGECHFSSDRFLEATAEFQRVVNDYPSARLLVPAAYLKMGRAYVQLEERGLAEKAFRTLVEKHPTTEEANQARSALQALGR